MPEAPVADATSSGLFLRLLSFYLRLVAAYPNGWLKATFHSSSTFGV
ncbi:MAG: hypothetical protein ACXVCM_19575 [Ktedonobacteraceae bacterium]